jgi:hypothetical protein
MAATFSLSERPSGRSTCAMPAISRSGKSFIAYIGRAIRAVTGSALHQ